jgi:glucosylceramidase
MVNKYAVNMIDDFNYTIGGFTNRDILLDEVAGPGYLQNCCFTPIPGNTKTGKLIFTNEYYCVGHFLKFIQPAAKKITASDDRSQLLTTASKNFVGTVAVIVMNGRNTKTDFYL